MKKSLVILSIIFSSCNNEYSKIVFNHYQSDLINQRKVKYSLFIPKGFEAKKIMAGGEVGSENIYYYLDSSIIYISDFGNSMNEQNIKNEGLSSKRFEYSQNQENINDTLQLSGKNLKGLYWKELMIGKVSIGYMNVNDEKKLAYDKALSTLNIK